jgi:hypothetical protein
MYFGAEIINAMAAQGLDDVPIGLIQSAIGGSQIESWMSNETLLTCKNQSLSGGAVPQDQGRLYYGMAAPFANYSVRGWLWYQGIYDTTHTSQSPHTHLSVLLFFSKVRTTATGTWEISKMALDTGARCPPW